MSDGVGRLQVGEVRDPLQSVVQLGFGEGTVQTRLCREHGSPAAGFLGRGEDFRRSLTEDVDQPRIELAALAISGDRDRGRDSGTSVERHQDVRERDDPCRKRDGLARKSTRPATAIPALEQLYQGVRHQGTEIKAVREIAGHHAVTHGGACQPRGIGGSGARQRRVHGCRALDQIRQRFLAAGIDLVARSAPGEVVTEPHGELVGVTSAADPREQRHVVETGSLLVRHAHGLTQLHGNQRLAQDVFYRLPKPQIDDQRKSRDQLGHPDVGHTIAGSHAPNLTPQRSPRTDAR